jgi:hypothetical protein
MAPQTTPTASIGKTSRLPPTAKDSPLISVFGRLPDVARLELLGTPTLNQDARCITQPRS